MADTFGSYGPTLIDLLSKDFGLQPHQAAGIVGQLGHESAGLQAINERNPLVKGSRGGFGWAQWTGPRRRQFEGWADQNGLSPTSPEANYGFLKKELEGPEGRVLDKVRAAPDAISAGRSFTDGFLRPGIPGYASRDRWTQKAMALTGSADTAQPTFDAPSAAAPDMPTQRVDAAHAAFSPMPTADVPSLAGGAAPQAPATPTQQPPASLFAMLSGEGKGAADVKSGIGGILGALGISGEAPPPPQFANFQAPQGPTLAQILQSYMANQQV